MPNKVYIKNNIKDEKIREELEKKAKRNTLWGVQKDRTKDSDPKTDKKEKEN